MDFALSPRIRATQTPPIPSVRAWAARYAGGAGPVLDLTQAVPGYPPHPDLLAKLSSYGAGALPLTGMVGATASLRSPKLVAERRKLIANTREDVFAFLEKHKARFVPSVSNKFMLEWDRPGGELVKAFATEKVFIGRVWPKWPNHARVSIGTPDEMAVFQSAYKKIFGV